MRFSPCSYLGFGLMAGRAAVLAWEETKQANPCIPSDHTGVYEYGGLSYDLVAAPSGASFETCGKLVTMVLKQDLDCGAPAVSPPTSNLDSQALVVRPGT